MNYQHYPKAKDTPSRLTRKQSRNKVFQHNRKLARLARRPRGPVTGGTR